MPCADGFCDGWLSAAVDHCCCCDHEHAAVQKPVDSELDGAQFDAAGHDADDCSLCTLLAKIKVGRLTLYVADFRVARSYRELAFGNDLLPGDLLLSGAPRGPPIG